MTRRRDKPNAPGLLNGLLNRRDWVYLLSLLVPLVIYNLALKASWIASRSDETGLSLALGLMRSDVFFNLGYVLLWLGLFVVARRGPLRWVVVFLFHVTTIVVVIVTTCAQQYFRETGTTLDYSTIAEWIPKVEEIKPILTRGIPLSSWVLLFAALFYVTLGPWLVTRAAGMWSGWPVRSPARKSGASSLSSLGLLLLALGFGSLSLLVGPGAANAGKSFARDPVVNVIMTGAEEAMDDESDQDSGPATVHPAVYANLVQTPWAEKRNVVLIHLESTRAQSVTPYNEELETTPFLDELAKKSLLVERAHVVVPRSSKSSVAVNCGIEPPLYPGPEFEPDGIPVPCLADLLNDQGYSTVFFASTSNNMDNFGAVVQGFGYEEFYPVETMDREGFEVTNTFGYEDDVMLKPSEEWLKTHGDQPFMAEYLTGTGHDDYQCLSTQYGVENFSDDELLNRYLNCLRLQDIFLENLFDQYKELGLYDNTIFVIFGDHGEGFGEHGRWMHGDTIHEEGLHVPLLIHAPGWFENGERIEGLSNQTDTMPTLLEMLGFRVKDGEYPGYSLLHGLPKDRTLMFSCISNRKCLASLQGDEKYIYHYDNQPDELFDLSEDPLEQHSLVSDLSEEEIEKRRQDLLEWRARVNAVYR